jgi:hypothetical protein
MRELILVSLFKVYGAIEWLCAKERFLASVAVAVWSLCIIVFLVKI